MPFYSDAEQAALGRSVVEHERVLRALSRIALSECGAHGEDLKLIKEFVEAKV